VEQQIFDGENFQPREQPRAFLAHAPDGRDRRGERRNGFFRRRHGPHDTNGGVKSQSPDCGQEKSPAKRPGVKTFMVFTGQAFALAAAGVGDLAEPTTTLKP